MNSVRNIRIFFAILVLAVAGVGTWLVLRPALDKRDGEGLSGKPVTAAKASDKDKVVPVVPDVPPPPATTSDPQARPLLEAASQNPQLRGWLAQGDLVRRMALAIDNIAEGTLQRRDLGFLAPATPFAAERVNGKVIIDPKSYERWDFLADAVASADAATVARAVKALHPILEASWRALGYPGRSFDARLAEALRRLQEAPIPREPPELEPAGKLYVFADAAIESLTPVEKLLVRMGPKNARRIQEKARQIAVMLQYDSAAMAESPH